MPTSVWIPAVESGGLDPWRLQPYGRSISTVSAVWRTLGGVQFDLEPKLRPPIYLRVHGRICIYNHIHTWKCVCIITHTLWYEQKLYTYYCLCTFAYIHVIAYTYTYIGIHNIYIHIYIYICIYVFVCLFISIHMQVYTCILHMVCKYACLYTYIHVEMGPVLLLSTFPWVGGHYQPQGKMSYGGIHI